MIVRKPFVEAVDELINTLSVAAASGWKGFDCSDTSIDVVKRWGLSGNAPPENLTAIREDLGNCRRCRLSGTRKNIVFGAGSPRTRLVFVGEGPGYDEDQQGEPFIGAAGKLLTKIIGAMEMTREQVYICNIVKCRPPKNRNPMPDEIEACLPFLKRQLAVIRPDFICALGAFAAQTLLDTREPISRLRGRFHDYGNGMRLMPTYHPAYLLRNPEKKRDVWEDIQQLIKALEGKE